MVVAIDEKEGGSWRTLGASRLSLLDILEGAMLFRNLIHDLVI